MNEVNNQVIELYKDDIIHTLLVVPKKSKDDKNKWRLVADFRKLNSKIINDKFPLTRLENVPDRLGRAKYFSTLDVKSLFHRINLDNESRHLQRFHRKMSYQFKRLSFGLNISSNSFQRMLTIALSGLYPAVVLCVDDIIAFES